MAILNVLYTCYKQPPAADGANNVLYENGCSDANNTELTGLFILDGYNAINAGEVVVVYWFTKVSSTEVVYTLYLE